MKVFLDTDCIFTEKIAFLFAYLSGDLLIDLHWSDHGIHETKRIFQDRKQKSINATNLFCEKFIEIGRVDVIPSQRYLYLIPEMKNTDPGDRMHAAAARAGLVDVLVTFNISDYSSEDLGSQCELMTPDDFLCQLSKEYPDEVLEVVSTLSRRFKSPQMTILDYANELSRIRLPRFSELILDLVNV